MELPVSPEQKLRLIEEYVPGKQVTIAHVIANPDPALPVSLGLDPAAANAIGIVTVTPGEAALILGDVAVKASGVRLAVVDRTGEALILTGTVSQVEASLQALLTYADEKLHFSVCEITHT